MNGSAESRSGPSECVLCGRSTAPGHSRCSVSCALAAKIPLGDGGPLPVSLPLFGVLASAFLLFNQFLLWSMFAVKESQGALEMGHRFEVGSIVAGSIWLSAALLALSVNRPKRIGDIATVAAALSLVLLPGFVFEVSFSFSCLFAMANLLIACRLYRGVYVLWHSSKKKEK